MRAKKAVLKSRRINSDQGMEFRTTIGNRVHDTEMSGSFLGDCCPGCQITCIYKAPMQNLKTKEVWFFR